MHITLKHSSYNNETTGSNWMYLLIIMLAPSPIPSQIPHSLFDIISLGVHAVLCLYTYCNTIATDNLYQTLYLSNLYVIWNTHITLLKRPLNLINNFCFTNCSLSPKKIRLAFTMYTILRRKQILHRYYTARLSVPSLFPPFTSNLIVTVVTLL